jgi:hypothetical protein
MAQEFNSLLDRLTHRLRFEPLLRLEIQRELRTHLDDQFAANRAAGLNEDESVCQAAAALGDPVELERQLWAANRWRMTLRAGAKWIAMIFLAPAACVACIVIALGVVRSIAPVVTTYFSWTYAPIPAPVRPMVDFAQRQTQQIIDSHSGSRAEIASPFYSLDSASEAAAAHSSDRALWADYACRFVDDCGIQPSADPGDPLLSQSKLNQALAIISQGEKLDPSNALYPLLAAQCLARASSRQLRDQPPDYFPFGQIWSDGKIHPYNCWKLKVENHALFSQAVDCLSRAADMPVLDSYSLELYQRRAALLPRRDDLGKQVLLMSIALNSRHYPLKYWDLLFTMSAHALDQALAGKLDESLKLEDNINRVAAAVTREGSNSDGTMESSAFYTDVAGHSAAVLKLAGKNAESQDLLQWLMKMGQQRRMTFSFLHGDQRSLLADWVASSTHVPRDIAPLRRAEYSVADQAGLVSLIFFLLALAAAAGIGAAIESLASRRRRGIAIAVLPSMGEMRGLIFAAAILPMVLYAGYVTLIPGGQRLLGIQARPQTLIVEYSIVILAIAVLGLTASAQIARRHLAAVGVEASPFMFYAPAAMLLLPMVAIGTLALTAGFLLVGENFAGEIIPISLILCLLTLMVGLRYRRAAGAFNSAAMVRIAGSIFRSVALTVSVLALSISVIGGFGLRYLETRAVHQIRQDSVLNELNNEADPAVQSLRATVYHQCLHVAAQMQAQSPNHWR